MSKTVTFDGAPPEGTINFGVGQPSADLLPVELVAKASQAFFAGAEPFELNYGVTHGDERFLESLAGFLDAEYGTPTDPASLFVSGGNSQALDIVSTVFANPGDTVFVEEPSYFLAFQIFRDHNLNVVGIPLDDEGIDVDALERALQKHRPAFLYTIPSYQNPGGQCLPLARRKRLVELALEHNFLLVADEVYQLLYFGEPPPPPLGTFADSGVVLSLGSFSKILAPGMRLGWIQTSGEMRESLITNGFVNSGGSINHISSHLVREAIDLGLLTEHVAKLRDIYRSRANAMHDALLEHFADVATWSKPEGGYFFWLRCLNSIDTAPLRERAFDVEVGFQPGRVFSSCDGLDDYFRLSFAHYGEADIAEGVRRLRPLFDTAASKA